jgi:hypothetical protein
MRIIRAASFVALVGVLAIAAPAAAQTNVLLEDDLTQPGGAFSEDGGADIADFEFGKDGLTIALLEGSTGASLTPQIDPPPPEESLVNSAIEVKVSLANKKTGIGLYCRRAGTFSGGVLFYVRGKTWQVFGRDEADKLDLIQDGKLKKKLKVGKTTTLRAECAKETINGSSAILTFSVNGKEVIEMLERVGSNGGSGLFIEGTEEGVAEATFSDLLIEELPQPTR